MARVSKDPEERRNELMDTAQMLFLTKGYGKTAVSDIVRQVGVAQGTFYYHFKSKAEILDAVIDRFITVIEFELTTILDDTNEAVVSRINRAANKLLEMLAGNKEIIDYLHAESNAPLHDRIVTITMDRLVPVFAKTVEEGRTSGIFSVKYSFETMEMILAAFFWQFHLPELHEDSNRLQRIKTALEAIFERVLGVEAGSFQLEM